MSKRFTQSFSVLYVLLGAIFAFVMIVKALFAIYRYIRIPIITSQKFSTLQNTPISDMNPIDFEHHCGAILESNGWKCTITPATGDYGVDVIADHHGHRVAFQVKKWAAPVTHSAIQEIVAGAAMYQAHETAVISISETRFRHIVALYHIRLHAKSRI